MKTDLSCPVLFTYEAVLKETGFWILRST